MRCCSICKRKYSKGSGTLFRSPKDVNVRKKWSKVSGVNLAATNLVCADHFLPRSIVRTGNKVLLLPNAEPRFKTLQGSEISANNVSETSSTKENFIAAVPEVLDNKNLKTEKIEFTPNLLNSSNNIMPPQFQEEPIIQMPIIKSVSCAGSTQTNTRFCGLVETSDVSDEFRLNCFYCSEVFPLEDWTKFIHHLKNTHYEMEEAFEKSKFISADHDYTPINIQPSSSSESPLATIVHNVKSLMPFSMDPLEPSHNPFESVILNAPFHYAIDKNNADCTNICIETNSSAIATSISGTANELEICKKKSKRSSIHYLQSVKTKSTKILNKAKNKRPSKVRELEKCKLASNEIVQEKSTEIAFEYSPRDIVDFLLDNIKNYPVLWQFDGEPYNEDFYEAVEEICKIINEKWSLDIDNLKMRRSINRILRFYCYLYPNANVENIDQYTCYYDKCAAFLPSSVNEITYARCSHCYICYKNDFDLKAHLLEEHKYLQWPYKCVKCKECFRYKDEYEFHNLLPHYAELFRCEPCNKTFVRRNKYNRHIKVYHPKDANEPGKYKCNVCGKAFHTSTNLCKHKLIHGERKHKCHLCPKSYFENSRLTLHLKSHRKEYDFMCEVCGKGFIIHKALMEHMKKHTGAKVTCNICNLKLRKSSLSRHLRLVHVAYEGSVEKKSRKKNLNYRRLIHSRQLPRRKECKKRKYNCKICNIKFETYKQLVEHNKELHSDSPKWPCKMCSVEFSQKLNLRRHYRKKHNLHVIQAFKLVEENEDLNTVLNIQREHLDKLAKSVTILKDEPFSDTKLNNIILVKSDLMPNDIYFEAEKIHSSTIQDEIMRAADNIVTQDIKIDYMNDLFTDLLKDQQNYV